MNSESLINSWTRRQFLGGTAAAALSATGFALDERSASSVPISKIIDTNIHLGQWPLRRLRGDQTDSLVRILKSHGVQRAWAGNFDALLGKDVGASNARLSDECRRKGGDLLIPFGTINPKQSGWEKDLDDCVNRYRMPGIRLYPNYHSYRLEDPCFMQVLCATALQRLVVQIVLVMEDERMMHPHLRVEPVDASILAQVLRQVPTARVVLTNALRTLRGAALEKIIAAGNVKVEIAQIEGVGAVRGLIDSIGSDRVLFGSHSPLFYFEAALLKLQESSLSKTEHRLLLYENALRELTRA